MINKIVPRMYSKYVSYSVYGLTVTEPINSVVILIPCCLFEFRVHLNFMFTSIPCLLELR